MMTTTWLMLLMLLFGNINRDNDCGSSSCNIAFGFVLLYDVPRRLRRQQQQRQQRAAFIGGTTTTTKRANPRLQQEPRTTTTTEVGPESSGLSPSSSSSSSSSLTNEQAAHRQQQLPQVLPRHVAFICDGNRRWAARNNVSTAEGHAAGAEVLLECVETILRDYTYAGDGGIRTCTFFAFSTENWSRSSTEISDLWRVMQRAAVRSREKISSINKNKNGNNISLRIRFLGDTYDERIPATLRTLLRQLERDTTGAGAGAGSADDKNKNNTLTVRIALNYGGRQDILAAAKRLATLAREDPNLDLDRVTEGDFALLLPSSASIAEGGGSAASGGATNDHDDDANDVDLMIRTSGCRRLSNFILWNAAYAELYFCDLMWPDFGPEALRDALEWYSARRGKRTFGGGGGGNSDGSGG